MTHYFKVSEFFSWTRVLEQLACLKKSLHIIMKTCVSSTWTFHIAKTCNAGISTMSEANIHYCDKCTSLYREKPVRCQRCGSPEVKAFEDPYSILNINQNASEAEIKSAFKQLSKKYHPDINPDGSEQFVTITEAYQNLSDPERRRQQDYILNKAEKRDYFQQEFGGVYQGAQRTSSWEEQFRREFYNMYHNYEETANQSRQNLRKTARYSQIGGNLGAIIGIVFGSLISFPLYILPTLIMGWFIGRFNPSLAPLLLRMANIMVSIGALTVLVTSPYIPFSLLIILSSVYYFYLSRRWYREMRSL